MRSLLLTLLTVGSAFASNYAKTPTDQLIAELQHIDAQTPDIHGTAVVRAFIAEDKPAEFGGGVIGSVAPKIFPQMRELVRRGVAVIPSLIAHLGDKRPTKLTVGKDFFMFRFFSDEYDPKQQPKTPPLIRPTFERPFNGSYTVKIGDVCYALIGQIVNRDLLPVRYQPTAGLVINSPVEAPRLVERAKKDWGNVTAREHMESLVADAHSADQIATYSSALKRLRFYYPTEYERQKEGSLNKIIRQFESNEKYPPQ